MAKSLLTQDPDATPVQQFDLVTTLKDFYAQDADPGAVGTGSVWKDTTAAPYLWWERNATNDGWDAYVGIQVGATGGDFAYAATVADAEDGDADVRIDAEATTGAAIATQRAATADGPATAGAAANATGTGTADTTATSTTVSGDATSGISAVRDAVEASVLVDSTATNARVRAVASDISLTATDDLVLTGTGGMDLASDGAIGVNALGNLQLIGAMVEIGQGSVILNIPTTDPGGGALWCDPADGFTVKVSQT